MYRFVLYHEQKAPYQDKVNSIIELLERIHGARKVDFRVVTVESMEQDDLERVIDDIRNIAPQIRGRIVSARNMILPLSKTKNLNSRNTPILMLYGDDRPVNVYPHMLGTTYFEIERQLRSILTYGPEIYMTAQGLLEEPIQKILADAPSILEEGMRFLDANMDVGFGTADVLLEDLEGRAVIVEIETKATEEAVAQVCRLAAGYASQTSISPDDVRRIILCQSCDGKTVKACRGANVELYRLASEKIC